jgi:hypothetical protein
MARPSLEAQAPWSVSKRNPLRRFVSAARRGPNVVSMTGVSSLPATFIAVSA